MITPSSSAQTRKNFVASCMEDMGINDIDSNSIPIAESVSVNTDSKKEATVASVLNRVFGLDSQGQMPGPK